MPRARDDCAPCTKEAPSVRPAAVELEAPAGTRALQELLRDLGFLGAGGVSGVLDDRTGVAVLGFQKWAGLSRTGVLDPVTTRALLRATRPVPIRSGPGRRIEVLLDRQVALLIDGDRVQRIVHISTGAGGRTPTGSFHVFRKERMSWSVPVLPLLATIRSFTSVVLPTLLTMTAALFSKARPSGFAIA